MKKKKKILEAFFDEKSGNLCIIMEYAGGGNL